MPRKIPQLKAELRHAGFILHRAKGSHTRWVHPSITDYVVISGNDGDDAKPYQERDVERPLQKLRDAQGRQL
jgi:predicted RNA binding protein YcfA (HicA-like mRNA interferase family)